MIKHSIKYLAMAIVGAFFLTGCTGTAYNMDRSCSTDYLLVPAISIPALIGACDGYSANKK